MWQTPKTDWAAQYDAGGNYAGDYFNWPDYERIRQNIEYISNKSNAPTSKMQTALEIGTASVLLDGDTVSGLSDTVIKYRGYPTETTYNAIESNLKALATAVGVTIPTRKTWAGNGVCPGYADVNRWESACLLMYNRINMIEVIAKRLPVRLNGGRF